MADAGYDNNISAILKKWRAINIFSDVLLSLAITCLPAMLLHKILLLPLYWGIGIFIISFVLLFIIHGTWKVDEREMARFLNRFFPELEESSDLLLKPYESLNLLEKMQAAKLKKAIAHIPKPSVWHKQFKVSWIALIVTLAVCFVMGVFPYTYKQPGINNVGLIDTRNTGTLKAEKKPVAIASVSIKIIPPAYTGRPARQQNKFNLLVEENAEVLWQLTTTNYLSALKFIFNDSSLVDLYATDSSHTHWAVRKSFKESGFYQVQTGQNLSELYKIESIRDLPPVIKIQSPKPYLLVDFGQPQKVMMAVDISDDYGIDSSNVVATIASGNGEAVKFSEQKLFFPEFTRGKQQYQLKKILDLPALGLQPGDELYYYVTARDNHGQENRSDIYIINIADTSKLMSMDGMAAGVNMVPEYFRSQRQIIIETEQLLKDKDTITAQKFHDRSNNLGMDQKLLRLRYGKFLGEESENEVGAEAEAHSEHDQKAHTDASEFGNASAIMDAYSHKHDNAEDASFFEPKLKAQLKATLTEMWKSELQLRIYKPREALPFAYKALRLLKDLQQKSRVYVAKTSIKTTPLKPGNRLTGDLGKIVEPELHASYVKAADPADFLRKCIIVLEKLKTGVAAQPDEIQVLKRGSLQLIMASATSPALYLGPLAAMRRILENIRNISKINATDIAFAENAFQKMLPAAAILPAPNAHQTLDLSRQYFRNLNRVNQ
jgi:hypothetical protein